MIQASINGEIINVLEEEDLEYWIVGQYMTEDAWLSQSARDVSGYASEGFDMWFSSGNHDRTGVDADWYRLDERYDLEALDHSWVQPVILDNAEVVLKTTKAGYDAWEDYQLYDHFHGSDPVDAADAHFMLLEARVR